MSRIVKAPLVIAKAPNGSDVYVYQGSPLPDDLAKGEAERLADYLEAETSAEGDESESESEQPAGNASLEEWREFARTQGATDADLDGKSRNDLRDQYGK